MSNEKIYEMMKNYMAENKAKAAWYSADEWGAALEATITPQRLTSMYKSGLVERSQDKKYYGDNNYRYQPI